MTDVPGSRRAGVIGWPIRHSLSPVIMKAWLDAAAIDGVYDRIEIAPDQLKTRLAELADEGVRGCNVTLPHKQAVLELCDGISASARAIGAANILTFQDGKYHGDNSDAFGFIESLRVAGVNPSGRSALVLGAGGASRAVLHGLREAGVSALYLSNRTRQTAETLASELAPEAEILDWDGLLDEPVTADLVINTTALGLHGNPDLRLNWQDLPDSSIAVDIVYTPLRTGFLADAEARGCRTVDGLGMLINQARPSFEAFFGTAPDSTVDIRSLLVEQLEGGA